MKKSLLDRVRASVNAFRGRDEIVASMVRQSDIGNQGRYAQLTQGELISRCRKYVAICARINAQGVAGTKLRIMREAGGGSGRSFKTKRVDWVMDKHIRTKAGQSARATVASAGELEEITDPNHPAVKLFRDVNPLINWYELCELTDTVRSLSGNMYWASVLGPNGWPVELWPLNSQFVRIIPTKQGLIDKYIFGRGVENEIAIDPWQVAHFKGPNPTGDPFYGMGDLAAVVVEADISTKMSQFASNSLDQGVQPGLIVTLKNHSSEQRKEVENKLRAAHSGVRNAAKSLVLGSMEEIGVERWEPTNTELAYLGGKTDEQVRDIICAAFQVPVGLLTMKETSLANGKTVLPFWQRNSLAPRLHRMEDTINQRVMNLFREALGDETLVACFDNPVEDDRTELTNRAVKLFPLGLATKNEARTMAGLDPVPDGDEFQELPEPKEPGGNDDGEDDKKDAVKPSAQGKAITKATISSGRIIDSEGGPKPRKSLVDFLTDMLARIGEGVISSIERGNTVIDVEASDETIDKVATELTPSIVDGFDFGKIKLRPQIEQSLATDAAVTMEYAEAAKIARRQAGELLVGVSDATKRTVAEAIAQGIMEAESPVEIARRVRDASAYQFSNARALTIARTETNRAMNIGLEQAFIQSGVVTGKRWLLSGDPCPLCVAMAGREADLGGTFAAKGDSVTLEDGRVVVMNHDLVVPPAHPNCGCTFEAILS